MGLFLLDEEQDGVGEQGRVCTLEAGVDVLHDIEGVEDVEEFGVEEVLHVLVLLVVQGKHAVNDLLVLASRAQLQLVALLLNADRVEHLVVSRDGCHLNQVRVDHRSVASSDLQGMAHHRKGLHQVILARA